MPWIYPEFTLNLPRICPEFTQNLPSMYPKLVQNSPRTYPDFTQNWPRVYPEITQNKLRINPEFYLEFTQNLTKLTLFMLKNFTQVFVLNFCWKIHQKSCKGVRSETNSRFVDDSHLNAHSCIEGVELWIFPITPYRLEMINSQRSRNLFLFTNSIPLTNWVLLELHGVSATRDDDRDGE